METLPEKVSKPRDILRRGKSPSKAEIIKAIEGSGGFIGKIAKKIGCERKAIVRAYKRWPELEEMIYNEREAFKDEAEGILERGIRKGNKTLLIFYLKTQCRERGYIEKLDVEQTHKGSINLIMNIPHARDDDQLQRTPYARQIPS